MEEDRDMVKCQDCGNFVPGGNLTIHQLRGCREAKKRRRLEADDETMEICDEVGSEDGDDRKMPATEQRFVSGETAEGVDEDLFESNSSQVVSPLGTTASNPISVPATPPAAANVVDLIDDDDDDIPTEVWPCPSCTFHNALERPRCEMCMAPRPPNYRPADPVVRERLVGGTNSSGMFGGSMYSLVPSGALVGGMVGAAGAYMRGRSIGSGVIQGALSGAVGGGIVDGLLRVDRAESERRQSLRTPPMQFVGVRGHHMGGPPQQRFVRLDQILHQVLTSQAGGPGRNVDGMSYEQLLQTFGDGTENRGANESDIRALPVSTVDDPSTLPNDHTECMICLETFKKGDKRTSLPCLHGFHANCVEKWLRASASCPICKFSVKSD